eukprot:Hpha_TRINITY_DN32448_c0_g1::TRINITY_DN32448_c0_g1_i1::g.30799::m.30799
MHRRVCVAMRLPPRSNPWCRAALRARRQCSGSGALRQEKGVVSQEEEQEVPPRKGVGFGVWAARVFAVTGWLLAAYTAHQMREGMFEMAFMELAFPRDWQSVRLCFDLLPPEEKSAVCYEFRAHQRAGYQGSLYEWLVEERPNTIAATGLSGLDTVRRLQRLDALLMTSGKEGQQAFIDIVSSANRLTGTHHDRLAAILEEGDDLLQELRLK